MKNNIKWFIIGAVTVILVISAVLLIGRNAPKNAMAYDSLSSGTNEMFNNVTDGGNILGEKVIYTANISLKTDEYATNLQKLKDIIASNNAGISNFNERSNGKYDTSREYMYANIDVRVPQINFKTFTQQVKECGMYVNSYSENSEDITEAYMDVESKITSLKNQEEVLNKLLEQAKNVSEIIEINNQLQQVIQQIEYNTKVQQKYDNRIEYSTVTITIQEVDSVQVTQKGFGSRIIDTITSSIDGLKLLSLNILLLVVYLLPFAVVIGAIVAIAVVIVRKIKKGKKAEKEKNEDNN